MSERMRGWLDGCASARRVGELRPDHRALVEALAHTCPDLAAATRLLRP